MEITEQDEEQIVLNIVRHHGPLPLDKVVQHAWDGMKRKQTLRAAARLLQRNEVHEIRGRIHHGPGQ